MPLRDAHLKFLDLQESLQLQGAALADKPTSEQLAAAHKFHVGINMRKYLHRDTKISFEHKAYANVLVAIELAPPEAQRETLDTIIPLIEGIMADHKEDDFDFYATMFEKLGPRLHTSNQALVLEWAINNILTEEVDELRDFASDEIIPNDFVHGYPHVIQRQIAEKMLNSLYQANKEFDYDHPFAGWLATLLPKDHPRYIGEFALPVNGQNLFVEAWSVPHNDNTDTILLTDPEYPENSHDLSDLLKEFSYAVSSRKTTKAEISTILTAGQNLLSVFEREAQGKSNHPRIQHALQCSINMCRFYGIGE